MSNVRTSSLRFAFLASIACNVGLATWIAVFGQNVVVKPLCWNNHQGLVVVDGSQTYRYMKAFQGVRGEFDLRIDQEGNYIVSFADYWRNRDFFWNATTHTVNYLVKEYGDQMALPPYGVDGYGDIKVTCELVRAVAIEPSSDPHFQ